MDSAANPVHVAFRRRMSYVFSIEHNILCTTASSRHVTRRFKWDKTVQPVCETLSPRKAKSEGHMADVFADSLFNCVMALRLRRRDDGQEVSARAVVDELLEGHGQQALSSLIIAADRGYGCDSVVKFLRYMGIGSFFVQPDHPSIVHTFLPVSLLRLGRVEDMEEYGNGIDGDDDCVSSNGTHQQNATSSNMSDLIILHGGSE